MLAEEETLIGRVDDDRILREAGVIEILQQSAHVIVESLHAAEIIVHEAVVLPGGQFFTGKSLRASGGLRLRGP